MVHHNNNYNEQPNPHHERQHSIAAFPHLTVFPQLLPLLLLPPVAAVKALLKMILLFLLQVRQRVVVQGEREGGSQSE